MSTVTLSQPHCAITSAEKPDGIASQPFTAALPAAIRAFSLFAILGLSPGICREPHARLAIRHRQPDLRPQPNTNDDAKGNTNIIIPRRYNPGRACKPDRIGNCDRAVL